ncbi:hypothetical protein [Agromyces sp. SYSU T00194]|uniref:hypothetical protein n=1 Tax=Agromyces chitinivorans TaxID=3158560 RepID=UPI00339B2A9F
MTGGTEGVLTGGYRVVRRIGAGRRCTAWLAAPPADGGGSEAPVVLRTYPAGAAPGPLAVEVAALARTARGVLPALVDVIGDGTRTTLVVEHLEAGLPELLECREWSPGEAVTLLAGVREAVLALESAGFAPDRLAPGQVMLDRTGRPRLVGAGSLRDLTDASGIARSEAARAAIAAYGGLVRAVGARLPDPAVLDALAGWCDRAGRSRPFVRDDAAWERELFAVAPPAPILRGDRSPAGRAADGVGSPAPGAVGRVGDAGARPESYAGPASGGAAAWAGILQLPEQTAEAWEQALDAGLPARLRSALRARRRPLLVGAAVAASVLVLALTALQGDGAADAADDARAPSTDVASPAEVDTVTEAADPGAWEPPDPDADPAEAAAALLARRARCLELRSEPCLADVVQPGSPIEADDRAWIGEASVGEAPIGAVHSTPAAVDPREVVVVDVLGDAVLVEVGSGSPETPPASVLIVRAEAGWRLRSLRE